MSSILTRQSPIPTSTSPSNLTASGIHPILPPYSPPATTNLYQHIPPLPQLPQLHSKTMPADEYTSHVRGSLKLKGSAPTGIKKKKKKAKPTDEGTLQKALDGDGERGEGEVSTSTDRALRKEGGSGREKREKGDDEKEEDELRDLESRDGDGKTASERAYEEMRRKRLHERLQKEGVKTHKQRVEELNKYLSGLSEHHDMPKIGPG